MKRCYVEKNFGPAALGVIAQAQSICQEYADDGYDLTLRQLYYQFVARGFIPNRQTEYKRLGSIVNDARMAGLIDWDFIVDRTRELSDLSHWGSPEEIVEAVSRQFRLAKWDRQPVRVEVWIEKEALAGVVERVCERLDVPFFACRGYVSQSEQWSAGQRFFEAVTKKNQRVVILHLGDHDPSGIDMTRDNRDRLTGFLEKDLAVHVLDKYEPAVPSKGSPEFDVMVKEYEDLYRDALTVKRIALNMDQVDQYDPPPNPAKLTDSRVDKYLVAFGDESWELDALPPDVLATLIEDNVLALRDEDLWDDVVEEEDKAKAILASVSARWTEVEEMFT